MGTSLLAGLAVAAVLAVLTTAFGSPAVVLATALSAASLLLIAPVWGDLQGESRFTRYAALSVVEVAGRLGVTVAAVLLGAGAAGAIWGFAAGSILVFALAGARVLGQLARSPRRWVRVLTDRERWHEIAAVAVVQVVLSGLSVADAVVVASLLSAGPGDPAQAVAAAGYQAVATIAKAPVYLAVAAVLVGYPQLRADAERAPRQLVAHTLRHFARLLVPAVAAVATLPPALALLVLPASYAPALALLPWLAAAGAGVAASTVFAMLLLALREYRALLIGLVLAALAMGVGLAAGLGFEDPLGAGGPGPGVAHGAAFGGLLGAMALGSAAVTWVRHALYPGGQPYGLWHARRKRLRSLLRYSVATAVAIVALALAQRNVWVWLVVAALVGGLALWIPAARARAAGLMDGSHVHEHPGAPDPVVGHPPGAPHVLHLGFEDPRMPGSGGGSMRTAEIDRRLAAQGYRITVLTTRFAGAVDRTELHGPGSVRWVHIGPAWPWLLRSRLGRLVGYVGAAPFFVRSSDAQLVVEDFFAPISTMAAPWWSGLPTVGVVQWFNAREKSRQYHVPVHWVERFAVHSHHTLVAVSHGLAAQLQRANRRVDVEVIGNGVDPAARAGYTAARCADVVFVGRLETAQKGLDVLLHAWAQAAPQVAGDLVIAGRGPDEAALRDLAVHLGVADRVRFAGWVAGREKFALMAAARLVVVPSRFETFGIVAAEALATGTPVLAADVDCLREIVPDETGVLSPVTGDVPTDATAFAARLVELHRDTDRQAAAARLGPSLTAAHDWDVLAAVQERLYAEVIATGGRRR